MNDMCNDESISLGLLVVFSIEFGDPSLLHCPGRA